MRGTRDFSEDDQFLFSFVAAAIGNGAVKNGEIRDWALAEIEKRDEPPVCLFDLMEFEGGSGTFATIVGDGDSRDARLSRGYSRGMASALAGISYIRGLPRDFDGVSRKTALAALQRHPEVAERFREVFPYIEW